MRSLDDGSKELGCGFGQVVLSGVAVFHCHFHGVGALVDLPIDRLEGGLGRSDRQVAVPARDGQHAPRRNEAGQVRIHARSRAKTAQPGHLRGRRALISNRGDPTFGPRPQIGIAEATMDVRVDEAGQDGRSREVDRSNSIRNSDLIGRSDGKDAIPGDEDDRIDDRRSAGAVDQSPAGECQRRAGEGRLRAARYRGRCGISGSAARHEQDRGQQDESRRPRVGGSRVRLQRIKAPNDRTTPLNGASQLHS